MASMSVVHFGRKRKIESIDEVSTAYSNLKKAFEAAKFSRRVRTFRTLPKEDLTLHIQLQGGRTIKLKSKASDTVGEVKKSIADREDIPLTHQILKVAGKPGLLLTDVCAISDYNVWNHGVLDMVLEETGGHHYVCVLYNRIDDVTSIVLKVSKLNTATEVKNQIFSQMQKSSKTVDFATLLYNLSSFLQINSCS